MSGRKALTIVEGDNVQAVEQLSLILMDSLDLDVKHGIGVDLHFIVLLQVGGKLQLVLLLQGTHTHSSSQCLLNA